MNLSAIVRRLEKAWLAELMPAEYERERPGVARRRHGQRAIATHLWRPGATDIDAAIRWHFAAFSRTPPVAGFIMHSHRHLLEYQNRLSRRPEMLPSRHRVSALIIFGYRAL